MSVSGTDPTQLPDEPPQMAFAQTLDAFSSELDASVDPQTHPFPTGESRWEPGAVLGSGGMGTVFVARDCQFGREVALKEMRDGASSNEAIRRFLVEALVTGNLEHPGVPAVYERGVRDGKPFYAMRKVEGETLGAAIRKARTFEERTSLLSAVVRVAHTLGFAHERGVVHRDVKPDNIVLGSHGETVLLDWGIARVGAAASISGASEQLPREIAGSDGTLDGSVLGTPAYMAPEQAAGRVDDIDERTDVFALGALLYHVLTGSAPYTAPTTVAVIAKALAVDFPPLGLVAPRTPPELRQVVETAMAKDPKDRYANGSAFADALEALLTGSINRQESRFLKGLGTASAFFVLVLMVASMILMMSGAEVSTIRQQGWPAYVYIGLSVVGLTLGVIEWGTRGAYRFGPLVLSICGITVLAGIISVSTGLGMLLHYSMQLPMDEVPSVLLQGLFEIAGALATCSALASIQLVMWAIGRRAALAAEREPASPAASLTTIR